jgi:uncharacterized peroxidase-related enzyme
VKAKLGMVPNLLATLARSPVALNAYLGLSGTVSAGSFSAAQQEVIALAVGQANGCHYCLSAHTMLGAKAGLSENAILDARQGCGANPLNAALATLSRQITEQRGVLADTDLDAARAAGLNDSQLLEVVAVVVLNLLTNYTNHIAATEIDFPQVALELPQVA